MQRIDFAYYALPRGRGCTCADCRAQTVACKRSNEKQRYAVAGWNKKDGTPIRFRSPAHAARHIENMKRSKR